jgi:RHS repeat-associated protein
LRSTVNDNQAANLRFTGKELDKESHIGLYYFGARYYDPSIGRFISVDPLAELYTSTASYVYALNNPLSMIDPNGMNVVNFDSTGNFSGYTEDDDGWENVTGNIQGQGAFDFHDITQEDIDKILYAQNGLDNGLTPEFSNLRIGLDDESKVIIYALTGVQDMLPISGVSPLRNLLVAKESMRFGKMDYLTQNITTAFSLIEGKIYNNYDAGNYTWGLSMSLLGYTETEARIGAHVHNIIAGNNGKPSLKLDSPADIRAIHNGFNRLNGKLK